MTGGYDGPVHFDYKPPRTEDDDGVWVSAAACMRNYLILRDKVRAFRADPEVKAALAASGVEDLATPTLAAGETWRDVRGVHPRHRRRWPPAAWATSTSTSSPSSTSTASGRPGRARTCSPAIMSGGNRGGWPGTLPGAEGGPSVPGTSPAK